MDNTPLPSIRISEKLHKKLQFAVEKSGMSVAEVRRHALSLGIDALARINYDVDGFLSAGIEQLHETQSIPTTSQLKVVKKDKSLKVK